jgi:hypothetical protein
MRVRCVPRDRGRRRRIKDYVGRVPLTHHMMFATGKNEQVRVERHSIDQGLDVVPVAKCNLNSHIPARPGVLLFVFARVWAESERIVWPRLEHFSRASVGQAMDRTASWRTTDAALVCFNLYRSASRTGGAKRSRVSPPEIGRRYHPSRRGNRSRLRRSARRCSSRNGSVRAETASRREENPQKICAGWEAQQAG